MIPIKDKEQKKASEKEAPGKAEKEIPEEEVKKEAEQAAEEPAPEKQDAPEAAPAEKEKKPEEKAVSEEMALLNDKYLRICAEYDNYRKRTQKEKDGEKAE